MSRILVTTHGHWHQSQGEQSLLELSPQNPWDALCFSRVSASFQLKTLVNKDFCFQVLIRNLFKFSYITFLKSGSRFISKRQGLQSSWYNHTMHLALADLEAGATVRESSKRQTAELVKSGGNSHSRFSSGVTLCHPECVGSTFAVNFLLDRMQDLIKCQGSL